MVNKVSLFCVKKSLYFLPPPINLAIGALSLTLYWLISFLRKVLSLTSGNPSLNVSSTLTLILSINGCSIPILSLTFNSLLNLDLGALSVCSIDLSTISSTEGPSSIILLATVLPSTSFSIDSLAVFFV